MHATMLGKKGELDGMNPANLVLKRQK